MGYGSKTLENEAFTFCIRVLIAYIRAIMSGKRKNPYCGVYALECRELNKVYVGSSVDVINRFAQHRVVLRSGKARNKELQKDWISHESGFEFKKLGEFYRNSLRDHETELCKEYLKNGWGLYNEVITVETNIINVPKIYIPLVKLLIRHLESGKISLHTLYSQIETL